MVEVRPAQSADDRRFMIELLTESWGGVHAAAHGELIDASALPALIAWLDGDPAGLVTYREDGAGGWEIVTLNSAVEDAGVGSALINAVRDLARSAGAARLWLITTNENIRAIGFYQRRGFDLVALHRDAMTQSRELKPSIPLECDGIPIRHELEFALIP
jgi:ribosomal protein S18 acetylase RimI-like enzyme